MTIQRLTPNTAAELAFELTGGSASFERAEQLAWIGSMCQPDMSQDDYFVALSLTFFLEAGSSPTCHITGHQYIDGALYLQRHGYYREAAILANLEVSHWLSVFMGLNDRLSVFPQRHRDDHITHWLTMLDASVSEDGSIASTFDERIQSIIKRRGAKSPYVSAWLATISASTPALLDLAPVG
ncbi:hypothetical protein [Ferrimicrobium acidiphilum]|jgi:hypothetical protein|uniref:hypothetical protein n=1 Tax=Ferrimicrobium acidiphilum TaxID=121039 RepID=UPI0023F1439A|nr:hypothetical protein [Ferrimicrobium acidiphilum]